VLEGLGRVLEGLGRVLEGLGRVLEGLGRVLEGLGRVLEGLGRVLEGLGRVLEGLGRVLEGLGRVLEWGGRAMGHECWGMVGHGGKWRWDWTDGRAWIHGRDTTGKLKRGNQGSEAWRASSPKAQVIPRCLRLDFANTSTWTRYPITGTSP